MPEIIENIKNQTGLSEKEIVRFSIALYSLLLNHSSDNTISVIEETTGKAIRIGLTPSAVEEVLEEALLGLLKAWNQYN